jgi:subtilisin family serine protease
MHYRKFMLLMTLWLGLMASLASSPTDSRYPSDFRQDRVVVKIVQGASVESLMARGGTRILGQVAGTDNFSIEVPAGQTVEDLLAALNTDPDVVFAEPDYILEAPEARQTSMAFVDEGSPAFRDTESPASYFAQTAYDQISGPWARAHATGRGVMVAVIDTGVSLQHPALAGRFSPIGHDFLDNDEDATDEPGGVSSGHGTFVSGIIALAAPGAAIMPIRALDIDGRGSAFDIARAIRFAVDHGAKVINMSFGMWAASTVMEEALRYAIERGVVGVAACGNDNTERVSQFPANNPHVISTGAVDWRDHKARFSNFGRYVKTSAPGENIYSAFLDDGFAFWSGTSFAVPFVAAEAALIWERFPYFGREEVEARLLSTADDINRSLGDELRNRLGVRANLLAAVSDE